MPQAERALAPREEELGRVEEEADVHGVAAALVEIHRRAAPPARRPRGASARRRCWPPAAGRSRCGCGPGRRRPSSPRAHSLPPSGRAGAGAPPARRGIGCCRVLSLRESSASAARSRRASWSVPTASRGALDLAIASGAGGLSFGKSRLHQATRASKRCTTCASRAASLCWRDAASSPPSGRRPRAAPRAARSRGARSRRCARARAARSRASPGRSACPARGSAPCSGAPRLRARPASAAPTAARPGATGSGAPGREPPAGSRRHRCRAGAGRARRCVRS